MRETGFAETASLPGLIGPTGGEGQIGLLARKVVRGNFGAGRDQIEAPEEKSWLVFADASGLGDALVSRLARNLAPDAASSRQGDHFEFDGNDAFTLRPGSAGGLAKAGRRPVRDSSPERIVYLWNLDAPIDGADMATNLDALLHLTQALESARPRRSCVSIW